MDRFVHWTGTEGNDVFRGGPEQDSAVGLGGNDDISTDGGNDALFGGDGFDQLRGGGGRDLIEGGDGRDAIWGGNGDDQITGGPFIGDENPLNAGDRIDAGAGNDIVSASLGHDFVTLGAGRDELFAVVSEAGRAIGDTHLLDFDPAQDSLHLFVGGNTAADPAPNVREELDSNHDGRIGTGDADVTVAHGGLTIDLGHLMDRFYGTSGHDHEQVTLHGITSLDPAVIDPGIA